VEAQKPAQAHSMTPLFVAPTMRQRRNRA